MTRWSAALLVPFLSATAAFAQQESSTEATTTQVQIIRVVPAEPEPEPAPVAPPPAPPADAPRDKFHYDISGYVKLGASAWQADARAPFLGQSDGFQLMNARVLLFGSYGERLTFELSVDGAQDPRDEPEQGVLRRLFNLEDAYAQVRITKSLYLRFGQSKAPFSAEDLMSTSRLWFVRRSIVNDGILPTEGLVPAPGLGLDRQLGATLGAGYPVGPTFIEWELAAVNGNGPNRTFNDNAKVANIGRIKATLRFGKSKVEIAGSGAYNPAATGLIPNRFEERHIGYGGDVSFTMEGLRILAMVLGQSTTFVDTGLPNSSALGIVGQAAYRLPFDFELAYRFAQYDPDSLFPNDRVQAHTVGLNYERPELPVRMLVNYTKRMEQAGREVNNDAVEAAVQVSF